MENSKEEACQHSPCRASQNKKRSTDEMKSSMKSCMSDPIGVGYELSSGGPLDEGFTECHEQGLSGNCSFSNWKHSNQHLRIQTTPTFSICDEGHDTNPKVFGNNTPNTLLSSPSAQTNSSDQPLSSLPETEGDQNRCYADQSVQEMGTKDEDASPNIDLNETADGHSSLGTFYESTPRNIPTTKLGNRFNDSPALKSILTNVNKHNATDEKIDVFLFRQTIRSHTSQGIPAQKFRAFLNQQGGMQNDLPCSLYDHHSQEVQSLKEELQFYKKLSQRLEEQNKHLNTFLNQEDKIVEESDSSRPAHPLSVTIVPPPQMWSHAVPTWQTLPELSPTTNTTFPTPQSISASPDPFSPFDQLSPMSQQIMTPESGICDPCMVLGQLNENNRQTDCSSKMQSEVFSIQAGECNIHSSNLNFSRGFVSPYYNESNEMTDEQKESYLNGLKVNLLGTDHEFSPQCEQMSGAGNAGPALDPSARSEGFPYPSYAPNLHGSLPFAFSPQLISYSAQPQRDMKGPRNERHMRCDPDNQAPPDILIARALSNRSQEASIQLQQQLKNGHQARKMAIINGIAPHLIRLSEDKHGNFLVQRAINVEPNLARQLQGHFVTLSLSQFGCHVVQKLLDDDDEELRKMIVDELLMDKTNDTLTCRNSIHIWQKVLEVPWKDAETRTRIIQSINERMQGRWAEMAMMETGSIICQNLFESGDAGEKEDCLNEILERVCECAFNQWGVWVVQHIIEHGEADHKRKAFEELLKEAYRLTLSQYGQKAIVSALKAKDPDFIRAYIDILCDRDLPDAAQRKGENVNLKQTVSTRRSILVDIATSSQGVQIMTQLLTSVTNDQRERIIKTVRKNSVFLKGSKAGLRVHQLCERARAFTGY